MRKGLIKKLLVTTATIGMLFPAGAARSDHIVVAALLSVPELTDHDVTFYFVEKESGNCCFGQPVIQFGDDTLACLCSVELNQDTPPGTYTTDLLDIEFNVIGTMTYEVSHLLVPPLSNEIALNTVATFTHTYAESGLYTAQWHDCCFGTPQAPLLEDVLQPIIDEAWEVVPDVIRSVESIEPVGVDMGTLPVIAL